MQINQNILSALRSFFLITSEAFTNAILARNYQTIRVHLATNSFESLHK